MEPLRNILRIKSKGAPSTGTATECDERQCQVKGYLKIQLEDRIIGTCWKRRYVVISEGSLNLYLNENTKNLIKSYPMYNFERVNSGESNYTFTLTFRDASRPSIVFYCESTTNRTEWVRHIENSICSEGDSGFESGQMPRHKTLDLQTTICKHDGDVDRGYSTIDECKIYQTGQDETGSILSLPRRDPRDKSEERQTKLKEYYEDNEPIYHNILPAKSQYMSEPTASWNKLLSRITIKDNMAIGSEDEYVSESSHDQSTLDLYTRYRTVTPPLLRTTSLPGTEGIPRQEISYPSTLSLPTPMDEGIQGREINSPGILSLPTTLKETWQNCFKYSRNFEKVAKKLLLQGMLPDDILLQSICKRYGRKSKIIKYITNAICQNIKEQSNNIVQVWPAFRYENDLKYSENHIIFVTIIQTHTNIKTEYQIYERYINRISSVSEMENKCIHDNEKLSDVKINDIALCLKSNANKLMENHKKLTCVTLSGVKSSGQGRQNRIFKSLCIALYVQVKGFIPIDEDPFEQFIDGYPVDVREGVFTLCGSPTELHHNVRMGCALDSGFGTNQGTIGPFFRYQTDPYTYLLTSAHVLLDPEQMKKLIVDNEVHYGMFGTDTYQPPESISVEHNSRHNLGKLEFAVYRKGGQYKPGMEVALVRINKNRIPIDGKFPSKSGATDDVGEFYAGGNCSYSKLLNDPYVYKFGSVTGLTKGRVRLQGASVRTSILYDNSLGLDITLHDQIEIEPVDGVAFGELGDSGSLVFQKDGNRLAAFGIFEGKVNNDTYMVTPILEIKQALSDLMSRYRDPPTDTHTQMDVDEQNSAVTFMLYYVPPSSNESLSAGSDSRISAEINRKTTELQTNILHHTDHNIRSVKAELTAVKAHIDSTKREIIETISSQISALSQAVSDRLQTK